MAFKRLILLSLLAASPSFAATILLYVAGADNALGETINVNFNGTVSNVWAGGINVDVGGTTRNSGKDGDPRVVFCIQAFTDIGSNTYDTVIDFANTAPATYNVAELERVAWLVDFHYPTTAVDGAGLQLAIWDILEDNGDGFSSGKIKSTAQTNSQVLASATNYEAISAPNGLPMMGTTLAYIYDNTDATTGAEVQDLIGQTPEPAAIILIFSGLALIGLGRLRRRVTR